MSKQIEYRVRAVTRYVVTEYDPTQPTPVSTEIVECAAGGTANLIAEGIAREHNSRPDILVEAVAVPVTEALPGRVMRCKVILNSRSQAYAEAPRDGDGKPTGRFTENPWSYERGGKTVSGIGYVADPTDPANIVLDGEHLRFSAVCPPTCDPNGAAENLIFGQYTPNFDLSAHVRNPNVLAALERGAAYYVDFTPAPAA